MSSSEAEARAASDALKESLKTEDLEQRFVELQAKHKTVESMLEAETGKVSALVQGKLDAESKLSSLEKDLAEIKRELNTYQNKVQDMEASSKSSVERSSRLEAESDNLREEIR